MNPTNSSPRYRDRNHSFERVRGTRVSSQWECWPRQDMPGCVYLDGTERVVGVQASVSPGFICLLEGLLRARVTAGRQTVRSLSEHPPSQLGGREQRHDASPLAQTVLEPCNRTHRTDQDRDAEDVSHANERMMER